MAQLKQVCTVANGTQTVTVIGVNVAYRIRANSIFMTTPDLVPYVIAQDATFDGTNTVVTLAAAYQGASMPMANGVFATDFTVPDNLPLISQGDVGTAAIWTKAMYQIQDMITSVAPDGLAGTVAQIADSLNGAQQAHADALASAEAAADSQQSALGAVTTTTSNSNAAEAAAQTAQAACDAAQIYSTAAGAQAIAAAAASSSASTAAAAAVGATRIFTSIGAGLSASTDQQAFSVPSADGNSLVVYQVQSGQAITVTAIPTKSYMDSGLDFGSYGRSGYCGAWVDSAKRIVIGIRSSGKVAIGNVEDVGGKVAQSTSITAGPATGDASVVATPNGAARTNARLTADVLTLQTTPSNTMLTQGRSGFSWPWVDSQNRLAGGLDVAGNLWSKGLNVTGIVASINTLGVANIAALGSQVTALQATPGNTMLARGRSGFSWPWIDSQDRLAGGLDTAGNLWSKGLNVTSILASINTAGVANLVAAAGLTSVVSITSTYARSGYAWAVIGSGGRVPLGLDTAGNLWSKGTNLNARIAALETSTPTVTFYQQQLDGAAYGVFTKQVSSHTQLFALNKATGAVAQLTSTGSNVNPAWSNDQSSVLFSTDRNGASEQLYVPVAGGATNRVIPYADLVGWGDSMTAPGSGYFDTLVGLLPGRVGTNQGIGGQQSFQIAARAAGFNLTCNVTGGQIPASGSVAITGLSNFILNTNYSVDAVIAGVPGTITEHYTQANVDNTFTFTPAASYAGPAVNVTNPVAVTPTSTFYSATVTSVPLATTRQRIHSIRVGRNDVGKVGYNQAASIANIDSIVQKIASYHKWFFVMGVTSSYGDLPVSQGGNQATDAASQTIMDQIAALNAALAAKYGPRFCDVQAAMIAQGYGQVATVNGSQYTVLNNVWSTDGIHETTVGKLATANLIINSVITPKGW
jgi:hypothetical protein